MPRALQKAASNEQKLDRSAARRASQDASHGIGSPLVGVGEPLLSRSGISHPRGKMDAELGKVRMHSETVALLQLRAAEHGMSLSEFVRIALECLVYGTENAASVSADRIRKVGALVGGSAPQAAQR